MKALVFTLLLTGCTIRIVDDTADYDIQGSMSCSPGESEIEIKRVESKTTGRREAVAKQ